MFETTRDTRLVVQLFACEQHWTKATAETTTTTAAAAAATAAAARATDIVINSILQKSVLIYAL